MLGVFLALVKNVLCVKAADKRQAFFVVTGQAVVVVFEATDAPAVLRQGRVDGAGGLLCLKALL